MKKLLLTLLLMLPAIAHAGPWCLQGTEAVGALCNFMSADECYKVSETRGGTCVPNSREVGDRGSSTFCLVTSRATNCAFNSFRACMGAANQYDPGEAGCVENTQKFLSLKQGFGKQKTMEDYLRQAGAIGE